MNVRVPQARNDETTCDIVHDSAGGNYGTLNGADSGDETASNENRHFRQFIAAIGRVNHGGMRDSVDGCGNVCQCRCHRDQSSSKGYRDRSKKRKLWTQLLD
jgi:hypothetical protein